MGKKEVVGIVVLILIVAIVFLAIAWLIIPKAIIEKDPNMENIINVQLTQISMQAAKDYIPAETSIPIINFPATWTKTPYISQTSRPSSTPIPTNTPYILPTSFSTPTVTETTTPLIIYITETYEPDIEEDIPDTDPDLPDEPVPSRTLKPTKTPPPARTRVPNVTAICGISPSTIPGAYNVPLTFWVQFSSTSGSFGFSIDKFDHYYSGQRGCSAADDQTGYASCEGSSGVLPYGKTVKVTFATSVGNCIASYKSN